jgi:hypothetical protein
MVGVMTVGVTVDVGLAGAGVGSVVNSVATGTGTVAVGGAGVGDGASVCVGTVGEGLSVEVALTSGVSEGARVARKLARNSTPWYWLHRK